MIINLGAIVIWGYLKRRKEGEAGSLGGFRGLGSGGITLDAIPPRPGGICPLPYKRGFSVEDRRRVIAGYARGIKPWRCREGNFF